ncbi:MAG: hypothetical protein HYZ91_00795 [Candidatus Omnitrophica bacterium]|nr:hypothetical protein [Candidatus Omnitrophota bacterium]
MKLLQLTTSRSHIPKQPALLWERRVQGGCWGVGMIALLLSPLQVQAEQPPHPSNPGEPVQGLQVVLAAAHSTWPSGAAATLEATLKNVGTQPFVVDVFGDVNELYSWKHRSNYLPSCWMLAWRRRLPFAGSMRGIATLAPSQFVLLHPGESHTKPLSLPLHHVPAGTYWFRLSYAPRAANPAFHFPQDWVKQQLPPEPVWTGIAFSNALTLEVVDAP